MVMCVTANAEPAERSAKIIPAATTNLQLLFFIFSSSFGAKPDFHVFTGQSFLSDSGISALSYFSRSPLFLNASVHAKAAAASPAPARSEYTPGAMSPSAAQK
jgi:hypothetical protein